MATFQTKRGDTVKVVASKPLAGELITDVSHGRVYAGLTVGKTAQMTDDDLNEVIAFDTDDAQYVPAPPVSVGPFNPDLTTISLADGSDYMSKLQDGELDGQSGEPGVTVDGKTSYDVTIHTQAEFDALIASPNWLGAKTVCFVGDGGTLKFMKTDGNGITVPVGVNRIQGKCRATIQIDLSIIGDDMTTAISDAVNVRDLHLVCNCSMGMYIGMQNCRSVSNCSITAIAKSAYSMLAFYRCSYISDCEIQLSGCDDQSGGFDQCNNIHNCRCTITAIDNPDGEVYGIKGSRLISNCVVIFDGDMACIGFTNCYDVSDSMMTIPRGSTPRSIGFMRCSRLSDCVADINTNGRMVHGFLSCDQLSNCSGLGRCLPTGDGYGFYNCNRLNNCNSYGQPEFPSTTACLGGTNLFCDASTVESLG